MSKLPIAAFLPSGSIDVLDRNLVNFTSKHVLQEDGVTLNRTIITLNDNKVPNDPVTLCVDGVLLWLLLAWMTAGTAAIITLMIKSCRSRWKRVDHDELNWSSLDAPQHRSTKSQHTRSTTCSSSVPSLRNITSISSVISQAPNSTGLSKSAHNPHRTPHSGSRRSENVESSRRNHQRSRRIQSTVA